MIKNKGNNNAIDLLIANIVDSYLLQLKKSIVEIQLLEGFDAYNGLEFIEENETLKKAFSTIRESTSNGANIDDCALYYYTNTFSEFEYINASLFLSITYYLHSKYLFDCDGDRNEIFYYISQALVYVGKFSGASEFKVLNEDYYSYMAEMKGNATKGGNKRNERYYPIKKKLIEIIENEKPKASWKDCEEFIDLMGDKLIQVNRDNGRIMSEANMLKTVKKWLKEDKMVAPVFNANSISVLVPD